MVEIFLVFISCRAPPFIVMLGGYSYGTRQTTVITLGQKSGKTVEITKVSSRPLGCAVVTIVAIFIDVLDDLLGMYIRGSLLE